MKYPQLVSMPAAVQDWLEEQLEARGIDAVVYTRYIVSLLKRDALDLCDDAITLEPNKAREAGRRKRGRRDECWDGSNSEQLNRSAAVECLMSASDQKCGIEKLVDDLCLKLKEIEGEKQSSVLLEPTVAMPTQSPRGQAQKYYAAFPALAGRTLAPAWRREEDKENLHARPKAWNMNESYDELNALTEEKAEEVPRRLYQRQADDGFRDNEIVKPTLEDRNLAQLIAKFDESIEALWSPTEETEVAPSNSFIPCGTNITSSIWSDCSDAVPEEPDTSFFTAADYSLADFSHAWPDFKDSSSLLVGSLTALNHSKEDSSFTEVIPMPRADVDVPAESARVCAPDEDDEDLLTSARTHFKPIKQEAGDSIRGYADGTTFVIPAGLEVLPFKRSRSGTLYLESEEAKYREYKEKEPYGGRCPSSMGSSPLGSEFIPKFKVCRNEKCIQTEEAAEVEEEDDCANCSLQQVDYLAPFLQADFQCLEHAADLTPPPRPKDTWSQEKACECDNASVDWSWDGTDPTARHLAWPDIWRSSPAAPCQDCRPRQTVDDRLRQELTQDGEQLLSDLSYMQHLFLGSDWLDDEEPSAEKFQCVSPVMYEAKEPAPPHAKSVDDFFSKCLLLPKTFLLSADLEAAWTQPATLVTSKLRKRRHSGSQRVVPSDPVTLDVTVRAQTSFVRGLACPQFILNHARALRPVTL